MSDTPMRIYEFGPFRVDALRRILVREGTQVRLPAKAFEILLILLEERGRLVEKDELMRRVWADSVVEESNLTVNMSALRKSLTENPGEHRYVVTVPGRGYQFVADVRQPEVEANPPTTALGVETDRARAETQINSRSTKRSKQGIVILIGALFATTIIIGYFLSARLPVETNKAGISSLAVLPFANNGDDPNAEYLSDGISESLINSLSQLPGLKVIARSSSFKYKGKELDLNETARTLGVEAILTGRVSQRGDSLVINVELVDARDKTQLWGEQYNRKATDLLQVQEEISREIAEKLRLRLNAGERPQLAMSKTVNPQAYELLLRGRFHFNKGSDEGRKNAVDYYHQAIAIDPKYAPAYAELAYAYSILGHDGVIAAKAALGQAEAAAVKAIELDEGLPEAHQALAYNKQLAWDWSEAERQYKRAIELNPNYALARASYSLFLALRGRHEQAADEAKRAKELDPVSIRTNIWVFNTYIIGRRYDQALEILKQMYELDPNHPLTQIYFGGLYTAMGRYAEAIDAFKKVNKLGDNTPSIRIYLGLAYAKAGQRDKARAYLNELQRTKEYVSPTELATLYAALGENDQAFESLERAYSEHDVQLQYLRADPFLDSLRSDARYQNLMERVGLSQ
ncbi:MAG TPA: winged helix-turn-helix domain-containing protein [Pyrinomonadaceae bacterium]|nr:winged helix-turn-helix domain-containing protein [Pyrinomonadaceae bacterium]